MAVPVLSADFGHSFYLFSIWVIAFYLVKLFMRSLVLPSRNQPPGPLALPIIGHFQLLKSDLPPTLQALALRYGPLMQIKVGSSPVLVVSDVTTAKHVLKTYDADFASKFIFGPTTDTYKDAHFFNAPYGPYWRFMKKLCMTKLFGGSQVNRFSHIREEETLATLRSLIETAREGNPFDLGTEFAALTTRILFKMVMGKRCKENPILPLELKNMLRDLMASAGKLSFLELFGPLKSIDLFGNRKGLERMMRRYDQFIEQILNDYEADKENKDAKEEDEENKDVVDIVLEAYNGRSEADMKLTRDQIKFFILEIFLASLDTTSAAMQYTMSELINHPKVLSKLREEITSVVGPKRLIEESDVSKLPYLQAVVKEALRLHPPGPLLRRQSNRDIDINGYKAKRGTNILINAYAIMRDPSVWKEPEKFWPERFLENNSSYQQYMLEIKGQDVKYLAFGSGRRGCLGASHALLVTTVMIGSLVQCFDWKMKADEDQRVDIKHPAGYTSTGIVGSSLLCYPAVLFDPFAE